MARMSGKARSACSGTTEASAAPSRRPAARCEDLPRFPLLGATRGTSRRSVTINATDNSAIGTRASGVSHAVAAGERGNSSHQNRRRHADAQARVIDVLDVLHIVGQPVLVAELPARRAGGGRLRHRGEQPRAAFHLVEQGGAMAHDAFAIFAERLAQREQPHQGCRRMKIESERGRSQSGQRNRAEEPDGDAGEQDPGSRGHDGKQRWRAATATSRAAKRAQGRAATIEGATLIGSCGKRLPGLRWRTQDVMPAGRFDQPLVMRGDDDQTPLRPRPSAPAGPASRSADRVWPSARRRGPRHRKACMRAMPMRMRCPPERLSPPSAMRASSPPGSSRSSSNPTCPAAACSAARSWLPRFQAIASPSVPAGT